MRVRVWALHSQVLSVTSLLYVIEKCIVGLHAREGRVMPSCALFDRDPHADVEGNRF